MTHKLTTLISIASKPKMSLEPQPEPQKPQILFAFVTVQCSCLIDSQIYNMSKHDGVSCDSCSASSFSGRRFKCLVCSDYDLCSTCYDKGEHGHSPHPMQCLLNKKDFMLYFGETHKTKAVSYTCPCCGLMGFNLDSLIAHAKSKHSESHVRVLCPVCVASRHALHPSATQDINSHLQREHSLGNGVRDIVALLEEPTTRRNNLQLRFPDTFLDSSSTVSTGQSFESVRHLNDLLSHVSTRYNEIGPIVLPRSMSRSQSRVRQRNKSTTSESTKTNNTSLPTTSVTQNNIDYSDRYISKNMPIIPKVELESNLKDEKSLFVRDLLLASLDPRLTNDILKEIDTKSRTPPPPPSSLRGTTIHIIKPVERLPPSVEADELDSSYPSSRRKQFNKSIYRRDIT